MKNVSAPSHPRPSSWSYALTFLLCVAAALAYLTPLDISIRARGVVRSQGEPFRVVSEAGGRITKVYVREGANVNIGDVLVQLDASDLLLRKEALESRIHLIESDLAGIGGNSTSGARKRARLAALYREVEQTRIDIGR